MPGDEEERPGSFAQHFLGRGPRRPPRVLRPEPAVPVADRDASSPRGVDREHLDREQLGLFGERLPKAAASAQTDRTGGRAGQELESQAAVKTGREGQVPAARVAERPSARDMAAAAQAVSPHVERARGSDESPRVWGVRALVASIRQRLEGGYADVWVEGEISNCRPAPSGHIYFTLKDGEAQLLVVVFRREANLLRFRPMDGLAVLVRGRLSLYESRGQLQLIAERLEARGAGALQIAFDQLKARLLAEGLFDAQRKRALPPYPRCVGVITSPAGAVLRDIVTVIRRRHAHLNLLVYPVPVQGAACASSVVRAIRWFNRNPGKADLLLLARGGGSLEDLAGFNDESVARAVVASELPVVSAIGHETDFTIADFASDLRAPTPSAAAEIITASQHRVAERVEALERGVLRAGRYRLLQTRQRYARLSVAHVLARVFDTIARRQQRMDDVRQRLETASRRRGDLRARRLDALTARLNRQSPQARLRTALVARDRLHDRLQRANTTGMAARERRLGRSDNRLQALSPLAVLARGYALVYGPDGTLISSARDLRPGEQIRARLGHGAVRAEVTEIQDA